MEAVELSHTERHLLHYFVTSYLLVKNCADTAEDFGRLSPVIISNRPGFQELELTELVSKYVLQRMKDGPTYPVYPLGSVAGVDRIYLAGYKKVDKVELSENDKAAGHSPDDGGLEGNPKGASNADGGLEGFKVVLNAGPKEAVNAADGDGVLNADGGDGVLNGDGGDGVLNADGGDGVLNADGGDGVLNADGGDGVLNADGGDADSSDPAGGRPTQGKKRRRKIVRPKLS